MSPLIPILGESGDGNSELVGPGRDNFVKVVDIIEVAGYVAKKIMRFDNLNQFRQARMQEGLSPII
jgi:hypothetical protein